MKLSRKFLPEVTVAIALLIAFFVSRLITIMSVPIFTDEAIYTRWAQIAKDDSLWRFISLTDGKQPSFVWFQMVLMRFVDDPLLAGRLISVGAGLLTLVGIYFLTQEIFKIKESKISRVMGLIAASIVVILPFSLVYDRLAIYDSLVAAFFVWSLFFQVLLVRKLRFDIAMVFGFVLGWAVLTKSSGFLSIYLMPLSLFLFDFTKKGLKGRLFKFGVLSITSIIIAYGMYSILRLSPFFHMIEQKNSVFIYSFGDWFAFSIPERIALFQSNFNGLFDWFYIYFTIPFIILSVFAFIVDRKFLREKIFLVLFFLLPFLSLCFLGRTLYPRYVLFMVMPLIPLVAYSIYTIFAKYKNLAIRIGLVVFVLAVPIWMNYYILFDFARAPIPRLDLEQYINGWPAGGGVNESIEFFEKEAEHGEIMVGTQGTFGLMPASYEIYLKDNKNIRVNGFWPVESTQVPLMLLDYAKRIPTYLVFYQPCPDCDFPGDAPDGLDLIKIASYQKGIGDTFLTIYQVKPQTENE